MRLVLSLVFSLLFLLPTVVYAQEPQPISDEVDVTSSIEETPRMQSDEILNDLQHREMESRTKTETTEKYSGTVGGVKQVSPKQFADKLQEAGNKLYELASPFVDMIGKFSFGFAAIMLILILVIGAGILRRIIGAIFVISLGIGLWYFSPWLVEMIKYLAFWFTS